MGNREVSAVVTSKSISCSPVVLICPNPTLDVIYRELSYEFSGKRFFARTDVYAGGCGINVARALTQMGVPAVVFGIIGGRIGSLILSKVRSEKIKCKFVEGRKSSRLATIEYSENSKGMSVSETPSFSKHVVEKLVDSFKSHLVRAPYVVLGGSFSQSKSSHSAANLLVESLYEFRKKLLVDTRGSMQARLFKLAPFLLKTNVDHDEGESDRGGGRVGDVNGDSDRPEILIKEGVRRVYSCCGTNVLSYPQFGTLASRPYGRGDAFFAGLLYGLVNRRDLDYSVRYGILAGRSYRRLCTGGLGSIDIGDFRQRETTIGRMKPRLVKWY